MSFWHQRRSLFVCYWFLRPSRNRTRRARTLDPAKTRPSQLRQLMANRTKRKMRPPPPTRSRASLPLRQKPGANPMQTLRRRKMALRRTMPSQKMEKRRSRRRSRLPSRPSLQAMHEHDISMQGVARLVISNLTPSHGMNSSKNSSAARTRC